LAGLAGNKFLTKKLF